MKASIDLQHCCTTFAFSHCSVCYVDTRKRAVSTHIVHILILSLSFMYIILYRRIRIFTSIFKTVLHSHIHNLIYFYIVYTLHFSCTSTHTKIWKIIHGLHICEMITPFSYTTQTPATTIYCHPCIRNYIETQTLIHSYSWSCPPVRIFVFISVVQFSSNLNIGAWIHIVST